MALSTSSATFTTTGILTLLLLLVGRGNATNRYSKSSLPQSDIDLIEFALNLEYLEADFFLWGAYNQSLDDIDPTLTQGGPPPIVDRPVNVTDYLRAIIAQLALQEVGHIRAIRQVVRGFPRPLLNISVAAFASVMNEAMGRTLDPPFDPYANGINFLLASYVIPYVGLNGYVGANPKLKSASAKKLVAGLLGVEAGQDALIRTLLYIRRDRIVVPYGMNVTVFTNRISELRNRLGRGGPKDEGLFVDESVGAEGRIRENILAGNPLSLSFERTPEEILRIVYGGGSERTPGGFYPKGAGGRIAKSHLHNN